MPDPDPNDGSNKPGAMMSRPIVLLASGLAMAIIGCALAGGINVFLESNRESLGETTTDWLVALYALYSIPTILILVGLTTLVIGAVRWGMYGKEGELAELQAQNQALYESINERLLLSDTAKRIAYRHEDLALLRRTIQHDIDKHDFDAAMVLVHEIGATYGYLEEAEGFREQINAARTAETEEKVKQAMTKLDGMLKRHAFDTATVEALKIQRLFPDNPKVADVQRRVARARAEYKAELKQRLTEADQRDDVDGAMKILKDLDSHLTVAEAGEFREVARSVIAKKRENVGTQFELAIHDHEYARAVRVGEQFIKEFPNTRRADEIRGMLDLLRKRAQEQVPSAGGGGGAGGGETRDPATRTRASDAPQQTG
ncbi:MAG: hypothetical protein AAF750_10540 [Planctomycetota bacterium]